MVKLRPSDGPAWVRLGNTLLDDGDTKGARDAFQNALKCGAKAEAYNGLGLVYAHQDRVPKQKALTQFRRAIGERHVGHAPRQVPRLNIDHEVKRMTEAMKEIKERNAKFVANTLVPTITKWPDLLPIGQLIVLFHSANGLGLQWGTADDAERRNYEYLTSICPRFEDPYLQAFVNGSFKPASFIHPFEDYFTSAGSMDVSILPEYFRTADEIAGSWPRAESISGHCFLSFLYTYFLAIHPFVDGNGRVARNLLDYYNVRLGIDLQAVWNRPSPAFKNRDYHKKAFRLLFEEELGLPKHRYDEVSSYREVASIMTTRKVELASFLAKAITQLRQIRAQRKIASRAILALAEGIMDDQDPD